MSYGVDVYAIDLDLIRRVFEDAELARERGVLAIVDWLRPALAEGGDPARDEALDLENFQQICEALGTQLGNASVSPAPLELFERVDEALPRALRDAGLSFSALIDGGAPVALPPSPDFPSVGHLEASVVRAAAEILGDDALECESDDDVDGVFSDLEDWIHFAAAKGWGLIGYLQ